MLAGQAAVNRQLTVSEHKIGVSKLQQVPSLDRRDKLWCTVDCTWALCKRGDQLPSLICTIPHMHDLSIAAALARRMGSLGCWLRACW
jgi:hypothetical protein